MSAFPDQHDDFTSWLTGVGQETAEPFVSRALYGQYLRDRLTDAPHVHPLNHLRNRATNIVPAGESLEIMLDNGETIAADEALVAIGQPQSRRPSFGAASIELPPANFIVDPWKPGALAQVRAGDAVLLLGTGLTMVDVALELADRATTLIAISRRGLLPHAHPAPIPKPLSLDLPSNPHLRDLVRAVRTSAGTTAHWSETIDGLRPLTHRLWANLSPAEQSRFLRHLAPYWNVHRHRMPPQAAQAIAALQEHGRLRVIAGSLHRIEEDGSRLLAQINTRGSADLTRVRVDHLVNVSGPAPRLRDEMPPLLDALIESGLARTDPLGVGLDTDKGGALIGRSGTSSDRLFAIGPLRRGSLLESTAIPELRAQARQFAAHAAARTARQRAA